MFQFLVVVMKVAKRALNHVCSAESSRGLGKPIGIHFVNIHLFITALLVGKNKLYAGM